MHLPTPQFSRLVTVLAFDLNTPSLDSMLLAWDHIATRLLRNRGRSIAGKIESIRLLAIHDAVLAILGPGAGFVFNGSSTGTSISAALAATAQASHDILANAFDDSATLADLHHALEESLSLISNDLEKAVGSATGSASAAAFIRAFGSLAGANGDTGSVPSARTRRGAANFRLPHQNGHVEWARSA